MGKLAWYKAEPQAFLTATRGMPFELKCAYRLVIDLIYAHDAKLPDDERFVAGQLGCDVRVWRRLRARLIDLGKLYVDGPFVRNSRCDKEVTSALASLKQKRTAGISSAEKRRKSDSDPSEGNGLDATNVATEGQRTLNDLKSKRETLESNPVETESLTPPAGPAPLPDPSAALWALGRAILPGPNPGGMMGRWCGRYGEPALYKAMTEYRAVNAVRQRAEPVGWITDNLKRQAEQASRSALVTGSMLDDVARELAEEEAANGQLH